MAVGKPAALYAVLESDSGPMTRKPNSAALDCQASKKLSAVQQGWRIVWKATGILLFSCFWFTMA
jgi:hypothetical protein